MAFPPSSYTERGGVATVTRAAQISDLEVQLPSSPEPIRIVA